MSEYRKGASPVKTILLIILCLITAGGIAAGIMYLTDRYGKPGSESVYIQEGLMMREEAELRMQEPRGDDARGGRAAFARTPRSKVYGFGNAGTIQGSIGGQEQVIRGDSGAAVVLYAGGYGKKLWGNRLGKRVRE